MANNIDLSCFMVYNDVNINDVMEHIKQSLIESGFNEKESVLYLAALELEESGMTELSKKAGLKRSTAYIIFESLQKRGLLGSVETSSGTKIHAVSPDVIASKLRGQLDQFTEILPEIKALTHKTNRRPKITYFEGIDGYITACEDSLKNPQIIQRQIGSLSEIHKTMTRDYDLNTFLPTRIKQNIYLRALYFEEPELESFVDRDHKKELREIRYIPAKYHHKTFTMIYENKVVVATTRENLITVVIESEDIAESERQKFDFIWDMVGKHKK
jgi:sugar-specific transcriptional regulator TrmB